MVRSNVIRELEMSKLEAEVCSNFCGLYMHKQTDTHMLKNKINKISKSIRKEKDKKNIRLHRIICHAFG